MSEARSNAVENRVLGRSPPGLSRRWSLLERVRRTRYTLVAKLLVLNVGLSTVAVAATGALTYELAREALRREVVGSGRAAVQSFARTNALEWLDERKGPLNLRMRLAGLVETEPEGLVAAYALDRERRMLAAAGNPANGPELVDIDPSGPTVLAGAGVLTIVTPVTYAGVTLGYTAFVFSDAILADAGAKMFSRAGLLIIALVLLDVVALVLVLRALLRPVAELGHAARELARGNYGHRLSVPDGGDEIASAARSFNAMCDALELHMRFSNGALVERIRGGGSVDEVQEPSLSIVFGDAQGYTRWSHRQRPELIFGVLNRYFTTIGRIGVGRFNGVIDKFMGDGVMAYFGLEHGRRTAPPRERARNALRTTLYAQLTLRVLAEALRTLEATEPLVYRFGIASGRCLVGAIGARGIMLDYSLIGNAVNLAARLEGKAPPGGLAIDRYTLSDAGKDFVEVAELGEQRLKGVDAPIEVFVVRGFEDPQELERLRAFLTQELLGDAVLRTMLLGEGPDPARARAVEAIVASVVERPFLPV